MIVFIRPGQMGSGSLAMQWLVLLVVYGVEWDMMKRERKWQKYGR